ncbi:hypothetical protein DM860_004217 [Cuscuta australis]|uniref:Uncharacterized protein n=1 Tax=Cuscuta australis TaxID=267555 RepID=A0A328CVK2_9ASTE|nr:hypothetical protein DM860_004217 [Cuscuta australis]
MLFGRKSCISCWSEISSRFVFQSSVLSLQTGRAKGFKSSQDDNNWISLGRRRRERDGVDPFSKLTMVKLDD